MELDSYLKYLSPQKISKKMFIIKNIIWEKFWVQFNWGKRCSVMPKLGIFRNIIQHINDYHICNFHCYF